MALNPPHPCPAPHCGRLTRRHGRCAQCVRRADEQRGSAAARGYTADWRAFSRAWLETHPWCGMRADNRLHGEHSHCARLGRRTPATTTDHIQALKQGGAHCDPANSQSLCQACNARKGINLEGGFGRVLGDRAAAPSASRARPGWREARSPGGRVNR